MGKYIPNLVGRIVFDTLFKYPTQVINISDSPFICFAD